MNKWNSKQSNKPLIKDKIIVDAISKIINFRLLIKKERNSMPIQNQINNLKFSITADDLKFTIKMIKRIISFKGLLILATPKRPQIFLEEYLFLEFSKFIFLMFVIS